jgi:hypothetical protein|uniref:Uncharacterized protein n=1 Tax=Populus trichocarpa TaxID=3694 RepID=A0A2K2B598_POPTR
MKLFLDEDEARTDTIVMFEVETLLCTVSLTIGIGMKFNWEILNQYLICSIWLQVFIGCFDLRLIPYIV